MKITPKVVDRINSLFNELGSVEKVAKRMSLKPDTIKNHLKQFVANIPDAPKNEVNYPKPNRIIRITTEVLYEDGSTQVDVRTHSLKGE